jgi:hypothetical protein
MPFNKTPRDYGRIIVIAGLFLLTVAGCSRAEEQNQSGGGWERAQANADALSTASAATAESRTASANVGVARQPAPAASGFQEVRNNCGACGTNSPIGGWESTDGRALILSDDGSFLAFFNDGTSMSGEWTRSGSELCLLPSTGGETCFSYEQKIDAMKLDSMIYIRK